MRAKIVVFDTNCVLCSGMVAFILAHERNRALRFVGAWSDEGLALAARHHFSKSDPREGDELAEHLLSWPFLSEGH
jgi:predicted DCC family thiol-disulfide oxidoreductase YuxK